MAQRQPSDSSMSVVARADDHAADDRKAMQTGGPSGGCIPEKLLDLEVGFDALTRAGTPGF